VRLKSLLTHDSEIKYHRFRKISKSGSPGAIYCTLIGIGAAVAHHPLAAPSCVWVRARWFETVALTLLKQFHDEAPEIHDAAKAGDLAKVNGMLKDTLILPYRLPSKLLSISQIYNKMCLVSKVLGSMSLSVKAGQGNRRLHDPGPFR